MSAPFGPYQIQPPNLDVVTPSQAEIFAALGLTPDYNRIHSCELSMAGLVFSSYKHRGWTLTELWEKLPQSTQDDIRAFVAKHPPVTYANPSGH